VRHLAALVMAFVALTGCASTVGGTAVPADTLGPTIEPTVPVSALDGLLLSVSEINTAMGATTMEVTKTSDAMFDDTEALDHKECVDAWANAQKTVYAGTGWVAVRSKTLREPGESGWDHWVSQGVVAFPTAADAAEYYRQSVDRWSACANKRLTFVRPEKATRFWSLGEVKQSDGDLIISQIAEGGEGWGCQRALSTRNNVAIDVAACVFSPTDQGVTVVHEIAAKVPGK
jgi:hypothetical protein